MALYYNIYKIYKITNCVNNKSYIGVTSGKVKIRYNQHKIAYQKGSRLPLHCDINEYGIDNFSIEILDYIIHYALPTCAEGRYMDKYNTLIPHGYNKSCCVWEGGK